MLGRRQPHIKRPIAHRHHSLQRLFQHVVRRDLLIHDTIPVSPVLLDRLFHLKFSLLDCIKTVNIEILPTEYEAIRIATWRGAKRYLC